MILLLVFFLPFYAIHLLVSGHKYENVSVKIEDERIWESAKQKLIRTEIGRNLNFDDHVFSLCKKAGRNYQC